MNKGCGNCLPKTQAIFSLGNIVYKTGTHDFSQDESQDSHKVFETELLIIISIFLNLFSDRTTWAKVYGTKYSRGYAIIVDIHHGIPSFGEIKEVLILDGSEVMLQHTALSVLE